ncbi:flagellar basal-body MS-ring/collar protein FliF [Propionivibrio sp.]|uniref:flagellar basal-body MS-ring/collar protein FliF n=1 Tax=Propionivibrio sp. TaxID=2212460 RepID=UPI00272E6B3A|nr:flagellar basal-body MS-ring/collar protein FliF [Propionivibrio sp.]
MAAIGTETPATAEAVNPLDRLRAALDRLTGQQKILLMVAVAALIAVVVAGSTWVKQSDYRILFSNIGERDGGSIIAALDQMNIPYKFSESGGSILIPGDKVHEVRLRLASQGLPKGGGVGFELMENQKFGISQFAEQVNYQRGLEGELSRTIQSISAVQAARVHLAIPKPTVFVREELKPSASVLLNLYAGRSLDPIQIAGVQNLVAASVPNLAPASVTIIDQSGTMLSQLKSKLMDAGLDPSQLKYIREIEANAIKRVEDILSPILGPGNYRVQVAADVDFSQSEQTAETHRPNATPPEISIRSQQTSESASTMPSAQGVPGALSNQPPVPATAPLTQPAVPGAGTPAGQAAPVSGQINAAGVQAQISNVGQPINTRKDSTINYEVDRTIRHTKQAVGVIKRLTAAVVVNHRKDTKGAIKPLPDPELRQLNDIVKEALGFSQERGDSVSVANAPFTAIEKSTLELPLWKDPEILALAKELFKYLAIAAIVGYLMFKVILPLVKAMQPPPPPEPQTRAQIGGTINIVDEEEGESRTPSAAQEFEKKLSHARELAQQDPKVVANIIKDWTGANGG